MGMWYFLQFADGWVAYGLGWGIGVDDPCFLLQLFQLVIHPVILRIGDFRCVQVIVGVPVPVERLNQFLDLVCCIHCSVSPFCFHVHPEH